MREERERKREGRKFEVESIDFAQTVKNRSIFLAIKRIRIDKLQKRRIWWRKLNYLLNFVFVFNYMLGLMEFVIEITNIEDIRAIRETSVSSNFHWAGKRRLQIDQSANSTRRESEFTHSAYSRVQHTIKNQPGTFPSLPSLVSRFNNTFELAQSLSFAPRETFPAKFATR